MTFKVEFKKSAAKEFLKLPKRVRTKIMDELTLLQKNPRTEILQIKKLVGAENLFRVRLGDYRMVYQIEDEKVVIVVVKIGHRREVYRN